MRAGCGINYKYLTENEGMRNAIAQNGAVISEYPPDEPPLRYNFPLATESYPLFRTVLL